MKSLYKYLGLLGILALFAACNEDPTYFTLESQPDEMHIKSSVSDIILNKGTANENAVTFTWDKANSPLSATDSVSYALRLYATSSKSDNYTSYYELGKDCQKNFTHDELNTIVGRWVVAGQSLSVTAEVVGTVHNEAKYVKPETSTTSFTVTGYEKYPNYLYIKMTDDFTGEVTTERLTQRQLGSGLYEGTFDVTPCTYHFTTSATEEYPAYGQDVDEKMTYVNSGEIPEFINEESGKRTFIVDTNEDFNDCRELEIIQLPISETLHLCGNGCSVGWDPSSSEGLFKIEDPRNPYLYSWTGDFVSGGELKVNCGTGWGDQFFFAPIANADPLTEHRLDMYRYQSAGGDVKWVPTVSGKYKFTLSLNAKDMWTSFEPVK